MHSRTSHRALQSAAELRMRSFSIKSLCGAHIGDGARVISAVSRDEQAPPSALPLETGRKTGQRVLRQGERAEM